MKRRTLLTGAIAGIAEKALAFPLHGGSLPSSGGITITGVTLSGLAFVGGSPSGTVIGTIGVTATGGTFSGSLSLSGTNASSFQIVGSNLETSGVVAAGTYSINIVATQAGATGSPFTQPETITGTSLPAGGTLQAVITIPGTITRQGVVQQAAGTYTFNEDGTGGTKTVLAPWVDPDARFTITRTKITVTGCLIRCYFVRETSGWASVEFEFGDHIGASLPVGNPIWASGTKITPNLGPYSVTINDSGGLLKSYSLPLLPYGWGNSATTSAHCWCASWRSTSEVWPRGTKAWPYYRTTAQLRANGMLPFDYDNTIGGGFNEAGVQSTDLLPYPQPPLQTRFTPRDQTAPGTGPIAFAPLSSYGAQALITQTQPWYDNLRVIGEEGRALNLLFRDLSTEAIADVVTGADANGLLLFNASSLMDVVVTNNSGSSLVWDSPAGPNHWLMDPTSNTSDFPGIWTHTNLGSEGFVTIPNGGSHTFTFTATGGYQGNSVGLPSGTPILVTNNKFNGSLATDGTLTVTAAPNSGLNNTLAVGTQLRNGSNGSTNMSTPAQITAQLSGTPGGTGTYSTNWTAATVFTGGFDCWIPTPIAGVSAAWVPNSGVYGGSANLDPSHQSPHSYAAFAVTGDPYFLMGLEGQNYVGKYCGYTSLPLTPSSGHNYTQSQIRGGAWELRDQITAYMGTPVSAPAWIIPRSSKLALVMGIGNGLQWSTTSADPTYSGMRQLYYFSTQVTGGKPGSGSAPVVFPWQEDYLEMMIGWAAKVLPGTVFETVQDFFVNALIIRFGGTSGWCQSWGTDYHQVWGRGDVLSWTQIGPEFTSPIDGKIYTSAADAWTNNAAHNDQHPAPLTCGTGSTSLTDQSKWDYPPGSYGAAALHLAGGNARTTAPAWIAQMTTVKTYLKNQMLAGATGTATCCPVKHRWA